LLGRIGDSFDAFFVIFFSCPADENYFQNSQQFFLFASSNR